MKIEAEKGGNGFRLKAYCFGCNKSREVFWIRGYDVCRIAFCVDCIKELREQIDAFRILVLTGKNTK